MRLKTAYIRLKTTWEVLVKYNTTFLCIVAILALIVASLNYIKYVNYIELTSKNIELTHKPIVFIKKTVTPINEEDIKNPFKHSFILTNVGKLPARETKIVMVFRQIADPELEAIKIIEEPLLCNANIYPNSELNIGIMTPPMIGETKEEIEAMFFMYYKGEGLDKEAVETINFIFSEKTGYQWIFAGPTESMCRDRIERFFYKQTGKSIRDYFFES